MRTLRGRFFLLVAVLVCANGTLALWLLARTFQTYELAMAQALNAGVAVTVAREVTTDPESPDTDANVRRRFTRLMEINPSAEIYVLDMGGRVLLSGVPKDALARDRVSLPPLWDFLAGRATLPVTDDDPRDASAQRIFSVAPLARHGAAAGFIYVVIGGEEARAAAQRIQSGLLLRSTLTVIGLGLAVALLTAFVVMTTLTRKLRRLARAIRLFSGGGFRDPRPLPVALAPAGDEVEALGRAYNEMAAHIGEQMAQIARGQVQRRALIAHVSHDLRTPLTSLRGYLETLVLRADTLPPEERKSYLEIAVRQAGTLDRLIGELSDLATLEDIEHPMARESFQLSELAQDVVQKLGLIAREKGVDLRGSYRPDVAPIGGDIGLIERLLDNLLENALRHTPSGGRVEVGVTPADRHVVLEVTDTGPGIPMQDLGDNFERRRRAGTGLRGGAAGSGLGLVIVKRIVELHGGSISVRSDARTGTTFRIALPAEY